MLKKFEDFCTPKKNLTFEMHTFFTYRQKQGETIDQFVRELKSKMRSCVLSPLENSLILTQLVRGVSDNSVREKLLRIVDLDLEKTIQICKALEILKKQAQELHIAPEGTLVNTGKKCTKQPGPKQQNAKRQCTSQQDDEAGGVGLYMDLGIARHITRCATTARDEGTLSNFAPRGR